MFIRKAVLFLSIVLAVAVINAAPVTKVKSPVVKAKVFINGAELFHKISTEVPAGMSEIIVESVASEINQSSIQVSSESKITLMSVSFKQSYLDDAEESPHTKKIRDSISIIELEVKKLENSRSILLSEMKLIESATDVFKGSGKLSVDDFIKLTSFHSKRLSEIKLRELDIQVTVEKNRKELERLRKELQQGNRKGNEPAGRIVLLVNSESRQKINLDLSYLTYQAGWRPFYDIRVSDISKPVSLTFKAMVWQNTGLDWKDVNLTISTRNPNLGIQRPILTPWYLTNSWQLQNVLSMQTMQKGLRMNEGFAGSAKEKSEEAMYDEIMPPPAASAPDFVSVENTLSVDYEPELTYLIPTGSRDQQVELKKYEVPAFFEYYTAPRADNSAFLLAYITDFRNLNAIPGEVNVYFENAFVGNSFFNPEISSDSISISLGRDKDIFVERVKTKDEKSTGFFTSAIERTLEYKLTIKNRKKTSIKIIMEDQIPLPGEKSVEIKILEKGDAEYNEKTGILKWKLSLNPTDNISKTYSYLAKYPGGEEKIYNIK